MITDSISILNFCTTLTLADKRRSSFIVRTQNVRTHRLKSPVLEKCSWRCAEAKILGKEDKGKSSSALPLRTLRLCVIFILKEKRDLSLRSG
jgi:hypothetical protein